MRGRLPPAITLLFVAHFPDINGICQRGIQAAAMKGDPVWSLIPSLLQVCLPLDKTSGFKRDPEYPFDECGMQFGITCARFSALSCTGAVVRIV